MIVIRLEMHPMGSEKHAYPLGVVTITNDGTAGMRANSPKGNYESTVRLVGRDACFHTIRIEGYDRSDDVLNLLRLVLNKRHELQKESRVYGVHIERSE